MSRLGSHLQSVPFAVLVALALAPPLPAQQYLLWSNGANGNTTSNPSVLVLDQAAPRDSEVADDFDVVGSVERVVITGHGCFQCAPPPVVGVSARFWEWTPDGPGGLQAEHFLAADDPGFIYDPDLPDGLDITLPTPFVATGPHFLSVQLVFAASGWWDVWLSNQGAPRGLALRYRDVAAGGEWGPHVDILGQTTQADIAFSLYGTDENPPPDVVADCGRWRAYPTPSPAGSHHAVLRDVVELPGGEAWAVGEHAAVIQGNSDIFSLVEHWDGHEWEIVPSPSPTPAPGLTSTWLDAVAVVGDRVWAAGSTIRQGPDGFVGTHLFVIRRAGQGWEELATPVTTGCSGNVIRGIRGFAEDDVWFVGDWCGGGQPALALHWDGASFTVAPTPTPAGGQAGYGLEDVDGVAPNDLWAVGGGGDGDFAGYSYIIRWDGSVWSAVPFDYGPSWGARLWTVRARAADDVWLGGEIQDENGIHPLVLHWDGVTLERVDAPSGSHGFMAFASDHVVAMGHGVAHWNGSAWRSQPVPEGVPGAALGAVAEGEGSCSGWAVGRQLVGGDLLALAVRLEPALEGFGGPTVIFADGFEGGDTDGWSGAP